MSNFFFCTECSYRMRIFPQFLIKEIQIWCANPNSTFTGSLTFIHEPVANICATSILSATHNELVI
jgi:hypothetical protein